MRVFRRFPQLVGGRMLLCKGRASGFVCGMDIAAKILQDTDTCARPSDVKLHPAVVPPLPRPSVAVTARESRDPGHDIVVIGASAGGIRALTTVIARLPATIDATLFVVQHVA